MLTLPANFSNDIQGRDTALIPVVFIGNRATTGNYIVLSTSQSPGTSWDHVTLPILLNIPSLKESIDISTRRYKISSVNIDISNYEYNGKRFSEIVSEHQEISQSLINVECRIFWVSPSSFSVSFYDHPNDLIEDDSPFEIYYGTIRRYTHDDEKVRLVVEDRSQATLHKDLPLAENYLKHDDAVPDKYKGKPTPMVYGSVDRSPLVSEKYGELVADSVITSFVETIYNEDGTVSEAGEDNGYNGGYYDTLWMKTDSGLINAVKDNQYTTDAGKIVFSLPIVPELESGSDFSDVELLCRDYNNSYTTSLSNTLTNPNWTSGDYDVPSGSLRKISDGSYESNPISWWGERHSNDFGATSGNTHKNDIILFFDNGQGTLNIQFRSIFELTIISSNYYEFLLLTLGFNFVPSYDHSGVPKIIGMKINDIDVSNILLPSNHPSNGYGGNGAVVLQTHNTGGDNIFGDNISGVSENYDMYDTFTNVTDSAGTNVFETLTQLFNFPSLGNNAGGNNNNASIQMGVSSSEVLSTTIANLDLSGSFINEMEFIREISAIKIFNQDFYANVIGRVGEYCLADDAIQNIMEELGVITAPAPANNYSSWIYAFTVDKKINSKKLIEGIASASPFIPRFDNMGNFRFDVIPMDGGSVPEGNTIKEADCIDFSFSRSKIEDVYTKIQFKYNWDYARGEFNDSVEAEIQHFQDYKFDYYGFKDPETDPDDDDKMIHPDSTLVIDDDRGKYIRNYTTAQEFAEWYLMWSCNQHLKMKIKLPLKYMNLEIGDMVDFDAILGGVAPYGILYTEDEQTVNEQEVFKNFLITSTNKTLEFCEIECIQMHNLGQFQYIDTTFNADISYNVIASPELNGVNVNDIYEDFTELEYLIEIIGIGVTAQYTEDAGWVGSLTELEGGNIYEIKFSQETTTNLFQLND